MEQRTTQHAMEHAVLGIALKFGKANNWIQQRSKGTDVIENDVKLKWLYAGYVARNDSG